MDQLDHDIVQDLLPLYHDGVCSDKSRAAVEEHLQTCQDCRKALEEMDTQLPTEKVAVDDAAAVKKISREWERGKWKARMKGAGIAVLVCLLLFGGWIAATEWFVFPVELENIQITNVRQLSDGRILYHFYIDDELGLRTLGFDYVEVNGEGHMYCVPKRALYTEKRETTSLADSEQEVDLEVCGPGPAPAVWMRNSPISGSGRGRTRFSSGRKVWICPLPARRMKPSGASGNQRPPIGRRTTAARRRCRERNGSDLEQSAEDGRGRDPA